MPDPSAQHDDASEPLQRADHRASGGGYDLDPKPSTGKRRKPLLKCAVALVLVLGVLIALAPMLLSTGPGTRWLVSMVSARLPGELSVDDLELRWFGGQSASGVVYDDSSAGLSIEAASIAARDVRLWPLVRGRMGIGEVWLSGVEGVYQPPSERDADARSKPAVDPTKPTEPFGLPPDLSGTLFVEDARIEYRPADAEPIVLTLEQDALIVSDLRDITLGVSAELEQGTNRGVVALSGAVLNLFDPDGVLQAGDAAYQVKLVVDTLPTRTVDEALSGLIARLAPGRLAAILGEGQLFARADVDGTIDRLRSSLTIDTPNLQVNLEQRTEDGTLIASPDSSARLALGQPGFAALFPKSGLKLLEDTGATLKRFEMRLPVVDKAVDWAEATAGLLLEADDNLAVVNPRGEVLGINDLRIVGGSESIADKVSLKLSTMLSAVDDASRPTEQDVAVEMTISDPLEKTRRFDVFSAALPIELADALMGEEYRLVLWLGETLELQADMTGTIATDADGTPRLVQRFAFRPAGR
ncbi:MAG: hypothetical protein ACPGYV_11470, partial [Phycisphaeraceae bacterium]